MQFSTAYALQLVNTSAVGDSNDSISIHGVDGFPTKQFDTQ